MSPFDNNIMPFPMVPRGFLKYLVLKLISKGVKHGYEIMNEIERITGGFWRPSPGSIYPLLSALEECKCIEKEETEDSEIDEKEGDGRRKTYEITEKGLEELNQCIKELNESIAFRGCRIPPWAYFFKRLLEIDELLNGQKPVSSAEIQREGKFGQINYCPYCGFRIKHPNARFCPYCGREIVLKI